MENIIMPSSETSGHGNVDPAPFANPSLLLAYANAHSALARIEERLRLSPVQRPWKARMALSERHALAWIDAIGLPEEAISVDARGRTHTSEYDLSRWKHAFGAPIALDALMTDPLAVLGWLGANADHPSQSGREAWDLVAAVERWSRACQSLPPSPPLLHSGRIAWLWRQSAPLAHGNAIASLLIGDRCGPGRWKGTQGGLTALGLRLAGGAWKIASGPDLDRLWLSAVSAGAAAHLGLEVQLRGYAQRAATHFARRRRLGRLKEVIAFAMARPAITSRQVAKHLGLTSAGAIKLLAIAEAEGLLIERTGQASFRCYQIPVAGAAPAVGQYRRSAPDPFEPAFWHSDAENDHPSEAP